METNKKHRATPIRAAVLGFAMCGCGFAFAAQAAPAPIRIGVTAPFAAIGGAAIINGAALAAAATFAVLPLQAAAAEPIRVAVSAAREIPFIWLTPVARASLTPPRDRL